MVPVVRPHPPASTRPGPAAVPVQRLSMPVAPESAGPTATGPAPGGGTLPGGPPGLTVRAPRPAPVRAGGNPGGDGAQGRTPHTTASRNRAPDPRTPDSRAQALQRAVNEAGLAGVPVRVTQAKPARTPAGTGPATTGTPHAEQAPGVDVEDLARRLLDPVSRLIRADLRRGRERSGRPYDGRR
ncbi:hypothetical protein CP967_04665 [Streptomyces nitrosporeus]|uniref:Syndecan 1 n=2 Tax=Streptomyces nitrosporeus TaxID=28894 RepID=A0A5J6FNF2_9ACTN|nr:hypothetical protein CP967_04665 [Streptomyces nitrosporeus]